MRAHLQPVAAIPVSTEVYELLGLLKQSLLTSGVLKKSQRAVIGTTDIRGNTADCILTPEKKASLDFSIVASIFLPVPVFSLVRIAS